MSAEAIPNTDRVQCKCGWHGTTNQDKTCPICGEAFEAYPAEIISDALKFEEEGLRRRFVHHARPKGPLGLEQAISLSRLIEGK